MTARWIAGRLVACLAAAATLACASSPEFKEIDWEDWEDSKLVRYRLVTKEDFQSPTAGNVWGNVAHGAEICMMVLPEEDGDGMGPFHAAMNPKCSFWNHVIGPAAKVGRLALLAVGVVMIGGRKQPEWYILQHEQVHFAIQELAARQLSRRAAALSPKLRNRDNVRRIYELTLRHVDQRHKEFDGETSGTYQPYVLDKWVRVLEAQLAEYCDPEDPCPVRNMGN